MTGFKTIRPAFNWVREEGATPDEGYAYILKGPTGIEMAYIVPYKSPVTDRKLYMVYLKGAKNLIDKIWSRASLKNARYSVLLEIERLERENGDRG